MHNYTFLYFLATFSKGFTTNMLMLNPEAS